MFLREERERERERRERERERKTRRRGGEVEHKDAEGDRGHKFAGLV